MPLAAGLWVILVAAIGWFYLWTAVPGWGDGLISRQASGYYNLLTRGFLKGHLSLDLPADPFLATLKDPWDPAQRAGHGLHDASYYRGKYYIYFGVTPVVVLFLPFRLLTGRFIDESLASPVFACVGLAVSVLLLLAVRRRYFPGAPRWAVAAGVLALGLADLMPDLLRRPSVWEVPITCGYACCMAALAALFQALHARRQGLWFAIAGLAFGLAVGCRPLYLPGCAALLLALAYEARARGLGAAAWRRLALAGIIPLVGVGVGLAAYNFFRFGSPFDFGFRHLMSGENTETERLFDWRFLWYNLRVYLLAPAGWTAYFPFVSVASVPSAPPGYLAIEDPYGVLPNMPFILLGLGAIALVIPRRPPGSGRAVVFWVCALWTAAATGLAVSSFGGAINRYMEDFVPEFVFLACLGLLVLVTRPWWRGAVRVAGGAAVVVLLAYSAAFNVLASMGHNELFRANDPALYLRTAHRFGWISHELDRWLGTQYGPVEMRVVFPRDADGQVEPLVVTGRSFLADYLYVVYLGHDLVRFGFEHTGHGGPVGNPVRAAPGAVHTLRIDMGSLYPPPGNPYFDGMPRVETRARQRTVRVTCDGQVVLNRLVQFYDAASRQPLIGNSGDCPGFRRPFSGAILSWRRLPAASVVAIGGASGPLRLKVVFPPFAGPRSEPLVSTGETGRGDLVYVHYDAADRVTFGHDHWGVGGSSSAPVAIVPGAKQTIEIDFGALDSSEPEAVATGPGERGRFVIRLNGRTVMDETEYYYPCAPDSVSVGLNAIGASTATPLFTGAILASERVGPAGAGSR